VVASAADSEVGAFFAAPLRVTLLEFGHKRPANPLITDKSTAYRILNETIKQKQSKSMDMKYYWLQDRVGQKQFDVYWCPGKENLGDYHTRHHPAQHHQGMRNILIHQAYSLNILRECVKLSHPQLRQTTDT
jgi:hypothetical protein